MTYYRVIGVGVLPPIAGAPTSGNGPVADTAEGAWAGWDAQMAERGWAACDIRGTCRAAHQARLIAGVSRAAVAAADISQDPPVNGDWWRE